jgi:hypothetical protein
MTTTNWQGVQPCTVVDVVGPTAMPLHGEQVAGEDGSKVYTVTIQNPHPDALPNIMRSYPRVAALRDTLC